MRALGFALAFVALVGANACDGGQPVRAPALVHAVTAEGLCAEHGVLAELCPRCNPKLAAIFQEKGDWCAEHGFPESFCPQCHPERGGKPLDAGAEPEPLDGMTIVLRTAAAVRAAGIEVEAARAPGAPELECLARIAYDARRRAAVNARVPGIVREVLVDVGARVTRGTALVRLESAELGALQARRTAARTRREVAERARERVEGLLAQGLAADKDVQAARLELDTAQAEIGTAEAALGLVQLEPGAPNVYALLAPLDGTVVALAAAPGRMVDAADSLCELVDVGSMCAELDVPETELADVALGQEATLTLEVLPGREFRGVLDYLAPEVDPRTRTVRARVRLANPDGALRANLFARARLALPANATRALVPNAAVQRAGEVALVFLQRAPDRYEARRVELGARRGEFYEIRAGLEPGALVATRGSFLLKTEVLKGSIGAGCCVVE